MVFSSVNVLVVLFVVELNTTLVLMTILCHVLPLLPLDPANIYCRLLMAILGFLLIHITVLAGFNEFGFNESSRFNESYLSSKVFFYFIKNSDLTNIRV